MRNHPVYIRASGAPRFKFVVNRLQGLVRTWFVSFVLTLVVASLFGCVSSPFLVVTLYIYFYVYQLSKRHMMSVNV
jgi:hypothetical protein